MQLHEILSAVVAELPNSFTEDFKAQLRTMDNAQFIDLWDALTRAHDTLTTEQQEAFRAASHDRSLSRLAERVGPHAVNRGAW